MVDIDVRLGLTPTDLQLREIQVRRPAEWVELDPQEHAALRVLQPDFAGDVVKTRLFRGEQTIIVKKERIVDICRTLRDHPDTQFNYLSDITAVDNLMHLEDGQPRFEVVYNLYSLATFDRVRVKAQVSEDDATIDTVESVWPAANWNEREVFDMFGIVFNHHTDLRRILMPDDWIGNPLRKDYPIGGEEVEFTYNVRGR